MQRLVPAEYNDQRILTTNQIAELYGTDTRRISENFNSNKDRYQKGKHFYCLQGEDLREFRANTQIPDLPQNINKLYLWTEKGALLHAKSLGTDRAWEVYDELVETYFKAREMQKVKPMSPIELIAAQAQALVGIEKKQKEHDLAIEDTNKRINGIKDVVSLNTQSWREDARRLIVKIAYQMGGPEYIRDVQAEVFGLVNIRGAVNLSTRLTNKRRRMADEGVCKSKRDKLTKVDIISEDKKLIEIYVAIVKEMAIKYGACVA